MMVWGKAWVGHDSDAVQVDPTDFTFEDIEEAVGTTSGFVIEYPRLTGQPGNVTRAQCIEHGVVLGTLDRMLAHTEAEHPEAVGYRCVPPRWKAKS